MSPKERHKAIHILFSKTVQDLDQLRQEGVQIPSDVYLALGDLRGSIDGIMNHLTQLHEQEIREMMALANLEFTDDEDPAEPPDPASDIPENIRSPLEKHRHNVLKMRKEE
jgi:hypothetical protein